MPTEGLDEIIGIVKAMSSRGFGLSLVDAIRQTRYKERRATFSVREVVLALRRHPETIIDWVQYSEDKRTSGGWYILKDSFEVGRIGQTASKITFDTLEEAVADFLVKELDECVRENAA